MSKWINIVSGQATRGCSGPCWFAYVCILLRAVALLSHSPEVTGMVNASCRSTNMHIGKRVLFTHFDRFRERGVHRVVYEKGVHRGVSQKGGSCEPCEPPGYGPGLIGSFFFSVPSLSHRRYSYFLVFLHAALFVMLSSFSPPLSHISLTRIFPPSTFGISLLHFPGVSTSSILLTMWSLLTMS